MSKEKRKALYLGVLGIALWLGGAVGMATAKAQESPEPPPVILTVPESANKLVVIKLPFHHIGEIPNLNASKISLIDNGASMGHDYFMTGVGFAHNIKTGEGIAVLEFVIVDDSQGETDEEFVILLEFDDDSVFGGSIRIRDNDTI